MTTLESQSKLTVKKSITIDTSQARAFDVFVNQLASWWPLDRHVLGEPPGQTALIEPHAGGKWFEIDKNGVRCDWGSVVAIDPPKSIVLSWQISADWKYDPAIYTEVAVTFIREHDQRTRVELEHRGLEAYGEKGPAMMELFNDPTAWLETLERLKTAAES